MHAIRSIPETTHTQAEHKFFRLFLDATMTWSAAYFPQQDMTLEEAQIAKYERLCSQLRLSAADHLLEMGTGWGGNAIFMAGRYGCRVTTLTMSEEQYALVTRRIKAAGLGHRVTVLLEDYHAVSGCFDKIVSVENAGLANDQGLDGWFLKCHEWLKPGGRLALQIVTCPDSRYDHPSLEAINNAVGRTGDMTLIDWKDLGLHYAATLKLWYMQFNSRLAKIKALGFDDRFIRKWNDYFCSMEAAFRLRDLHVLQLAYARPRDPSR